MAAKDRTRVRKTKKEDDEDDKTSLLELSAKGGQPTDRRSPYPDVVGRTATPGYEFFGPETLLAPESGQGGSSV